MLVKQYVDNFLMHLDLADNGISHVLYSVGEREKAYMSILDKTV